MTTKSKKKASALPPVSTIGIEELMPPIKSENPETLKQHNKSLEAANFALNDFNNKLMLQLADKEKQIAHLQDLLVSSPNIPTFSGDGLLTVTPEETLIQIQIQKIQASAMTRELTLDEVKRFDLLMKNKNLIQERPTEINGKSKTSAKQLSKEQLVGIAARKTTEENS